MPQDVDGPTCAPFTQVINEVQVGSLGSAILVVLLLVYEAHGPDRVVVVIVLVVVVVVVVVVMVVVVVWHLTGKKNTSPSSHFVVATS